jgi:hypothetical protein
LPRETHCTASPWGPSAFGLRMTGLMPSRRRCVRRGRRREEAYPAGALGGTAGASSLRMTPFSLRHWITALLLSSAAGLGQGCYVETVPDPVYADGYQPSFYDGYVVYYDGIGRPFYYVNGSPFWVPVHSPYYAGLVNHWHTYGPAYGHWYAHYGYRYQGFRGGRRRL